MWIRSSVVLVDRIVSFCGKGQKIAKFLIAGPSAHICDECTLSCMDMFLHHYEKENLSIVAMLEEMSVGVTYEPLSKTHQPPAHDKQITQCSDPVAR